MTDVTTPLAPERETETPERANRYLVGLLVTGVAVIAAVMYVRWLAPLVVAAIVVGAGFTLKRVSRRAAARAETAEREQFATEAVQHLATELSSAVTTAAVARTLVERVPELLGASGAALGLIDGDKLEIVDPGGTTRQALEPGMRLDLGLRATITTAARTGEPTLAPNRERLEADFPDAARIAPFAAASLAMPLRSGGAVVGSIAFPFAEPDRIDEEVISRARFAADLGGQALERAELYEQERRSREALDRISRLAPRFGSESPESVLRTVCSEAIDTFGVDVAQIWGIEGNVFHVLWRQPEAAAFPPGSRVPVEDFPGLAEAIQRLEPKFIHDSWTEVRGIALDLAREFGIRSSIRVPIAVGGRAERVLVLQWTSIQPAPSPPTIVLARRFADQAGLALGYAERRVAQTAAVRNAEETRRLLDVTGALVAALEPEAVADAALSESFRGLGASAGAVVRQSGTRDLELVAVRGFPADMVTGRAFDLDAELPLSDAVRRNTVVALESPAERARRYPALRASVTPHAAWLALPLVAGGRVVGGLGLAFASMRTFTDADREFGLALSRQVGQALERATLLETEHVARMRAERMASDLAQLHALATSLASAGLADEVMRIIGEQLIQSVGARGVGVYTLSPTGETLSLLSIGGRLSMDDGLDDVQELSMDDPLPVVEVVRSGRSMWLAGDEQADGSGGGAADLQGVYGATAVGIVPLVVEQASIGALFVLFEQGKVPSDEDRRFAETVARQAAQTLGRVRLLEDERSSRRKAERASLQIRRLQTVTESLSRAATRAAVAEVVVDEGGAVLSADGALVHVEGAEAGKLDLLASSGCPQELRDAVVALDLTTPTPIHEAYASATTVVLHVSAEDNPDDTRFDRLLREGGFRSVLLVPLRIGGETIGVLTAGFADERTFDDEDRRTASSLGRQCAQALERSRLFDEERIARDRSERLQALTAALSNALTPDEVIQVFLVQAASATGASAVALALVDDAGSVVDDPGWRGDHALLPPELLDAGPRTTTPVRDAIARSRPLYFDSTSALVRTYPALGRDGSDDERRSYAYVPLLAGIEPYAVAVLTWPREAFLDWDDRAFVEAFASQCGQALDRAQRYETERTIAETLQRSVLPETLPSMEGATVAARYLPGTTAVDVGGDWFDTIPLPDGRLGFVVGDVVGKGVSAAATMAQLRNGMRALTLDSSDPAIIVTKLNRLLDGVTDAPFATLAFVTVEPDTGRAAMVSAGHLPPLVLSADEREPRLLEGFRGLPLGVDPEATYEVWTTRLEPGSAIVLYTDGLVERRDRSLDEGLRLLTEAVAGVDASPAELVDLIIERLVGGQDRGDDIAVLAVGLDRAPLGTFSVRLPSQQASLLELRREFAGWLERSGIAEGDRRDVMLATWEASANAIEHAFEPSHPVIEVEAMLTGDKVRVEVADTGMWREPGERDDRGLGLHLIQSLMTSMTVEQGSGGTRVIMERALSRERAGDGGIHVGTNAVDNRRR